VLRKDDILASDGGHVIILKRLATCMIAHDTSEGSTNRLRGHYPAGKYRQAVSATCT